MTVRTTLVIGAIALAATSVAGVAARQQLRDGAFMAAPAPPEGTATISGTLTTDDREGRPVRRASVQLIADRGARFGASDDEGHFTFSKVIAGTYALAASKPGL